MDLKSVFQGLRWGGSETRSGPGSTIGGTRQLREALPALLKKYKIAVVNDAGCGDQHWIRALQLGVDYLGYDVMTDARQTMPFCELDVTSEVMRPADLILCKDVFIHLPIELALRAIGLFRQSAPLLLSTSDPAAKNVDIRAGQFRPINLMAPPFNLGEPIERIEEPQWHRFQGLWRL